MPARNTRATFSGSYTKALKEIGRKLDEFSRAGIEVLAPENARYSHTVVDFVYLEGEKGSPLEREREHLSLIARSDLLYVVNPKGYLGKSTLIEIGYAVALGIPVYSMEKIGDSVWDSQIKSGMDAAEIKRDVWSGRRPRRQPAKAQ